MLLYLSIYNHILKENKQKRDAVCLAVSTRTGMEDKGNGCLVE